MNKTNIIAVSAAALVALVAVGAIAASTYAQDDTTTDTDTFMPRFGMHQDLSQEEIGQLEADREARRAEREAIHEQVEAAIEAGDYQAWVDAHGDDMPMMSGVTEDNFSSLVQAHGIMEEAHDKMDEARSILEDAGIEQGFGMGGRMGGCGMHGFKGMGPGGLGQ